MNPDIRIIKFNSPAYEEFVELRHEILRKPLGMQFTPEQLEADKNDILIAAYLEGHICGTLILQSYTEGRVKMRQVAVREDLQGSGIGKAMVKFSEEIAAEKGFKKMVLHARKPAVAFYQNSGYTITSDEFLEVGIPHYAMEKELQSGGRSS